MVTCPSVLAQETVVQYVNSTGDYSALMFLKPLQVCNDLRDLSVHLNEVSISYFNPFRPMLGQRAAIDQVGCQVGGWVDGIVIGGVVI